MTIEQQELSDPKDYFPYIEHTLDQPNPKAYIFRTRIYTGIFSREQKTDEAWTFSGPSSLFREMVIHNYQPHQAIAADPKAVEVVLPRHRSLYDYVINQPVHHDFINPRIIIVAGHNLFVNKFQHVLRHFGGFMFLRENTLLRRKGLQNAYLSKDTYLKSVFPAYMEDQVFCTDKPKHDLLAYLEYEKDQQGRASSGRTKKGSLRPLNWSFIRVLHDLARNRGVDLYMAPCNIGFSKYPDAPYIVHPTSLKGNMQRLRYLLEQDFIFRRYTFFAKKHKEAKLDVTVNYGEPVRMADVSLQSFRDYKEFGDLLRRKISRLEPIFPLEFVYRALDDKTSMHMDALTESFKRLLEMYLERGIDVSRITDPSGDLLPPGELVESAVKTVNTNPNYGILNYDYRSLLCCTSRNIVSNDIKLQQWYIENIRHIEEE